MPPTHQKAAYHARRAVEIAQASLLGRLEALAALVEGVAAEHHGVKALVDGVKEDLGAQTLAMQNMMETIAYEHRRPTAAAASATKVFGTPELLERILLWTNTRTTFDCYRVSKDFYNTIQGSPKLQRKVGLLADPDAHISFKARVFVDRESGIQFEQDSHGHVDTDYGPVASVCLSATAAAEDTIAKPGARLGAILLTQPPVKSLSVELSCCAARTFASPITSLHNSTGITIGQVRNVIVKLREEHRMCPRAPLEDHDHEGRVSPRITLTGDLLLKDDDYSVLQERKLQDDLQREEDEQNEFEKRMMPFVNAKQAGKFHGLRCSRHTSCTC